MKEQFIMSTTKRSDILCINEDESRSEVFDTENTVFAECVEICIYEAKTFTKCEFPKLKKITISNYYGKPEPFTYFVNCTFSKNLLNIEIFGKCVISFIDKSKSDFSSILFDEDGKSMLILKDENISSNYIRPHDMTFHCTYEDRLATTIIPYQKHFCLSECYNVILKTTEAFFISNFACDVLIENIITNKKTFAGKATFVNLDTNSEHDPFVKAILDQSIDPENKILWYVGDIPKDWAKNKHEFILTKLMNFSDVTISGNIETGAFANCSIMWNKLTINKGNVGAFAFGRDSHDYNSSEEIKIMCDEIYIEGVIASYAFNKVKFCNVQKLTITSAFEKSIFDSCGSIEDVEINNIHTHLINIQISNLKFDTILENICVYADNFDIANSKQLEFIAKASQEPRDALQKLTHDTKKEHYIRNINIREIVSENGRPTIRIPDHLRNKFLCINWENAKMASPVVGLINGNDNGNGNSNDNGNNSETITTDLLYYDLFDETICALQIEDFIEETKELYERNIFFADVLHSNDNEDYNFFPQIGANYVFVQNKNGKYVFIGDLYVRENTYIDYLSAITPEEYLNSIFAVFIFFYACYLLSPLIHSTKK